MTHRKVRELLYEYSVSGLDDHLRRKIAAHLSRCNVCSREQEAIGKLLGAMSQGVDDPSSRLDESYWMSFRSEVGSRIREMNPRPGFLAWIHQNLFTPSRLRPRIAIAVGGLALLLALIIFRPFSDREPVNAVREERFSPSVGVTAGGSSDVADYFRKSRALLVEISNIDPGSTVPVDLTFEKQFSRDLVTQSEALRSAHIDPKSSKLIGEVDPILVRVSTVDGADQEPEVRKIREEIRRQNLLLKLRVAESAHSRIPVITVGNRK